MTPVTAYILGILTVIIIIFTFWTFSLLFSSVKTAYDSTFCR